MKYIIRPVLPTSRQIQEIDETKYTEITNARKLAWDILLIKELFSYVVGNFLQLEGEIKKIESEAKKHSNTFQKRVRSGSFRLDNSYAFNLLTFNLLSTCRTYIELFDYRGQNEKREAFNHQQNIHDILENIKAEYHDKNFICMFFWVLGNYAQHHSSPIIGSPLNISDTIIKIGFSVDASRILSRLTEAQRKKLDISDSIHNFRIYLEENFNYYNQQELQNYPKQLNIRPIIEEYILLIEKIQDKATEKLDTELIKAKEILTKNVKCYCQNDSPESAFEIFIQNDETQELEEHFDISLKLINQWEETIKKYSYLKPTTNC